MDAAGGDNGAEISVDFGAPAGSEAVRDLAEDHAWSKPALGSVVGWLDVASRHEHQQLVACVDPDGGMQMDAFAVGRRQREQPVEFALQVACVSRDRGVRNCRTLAADGAGPLQKRFETGREHAVAGIDGVLGVADQMREAELMRLGVPALDRKSVV